MTATIGLCSYTHDSAAALIVDGEFVGFAEEERFSGIKHTGHYPRLAVEWLLDENHLTRADIGVVACNFQPRRYLRAIGQLPRHLAHRETCGRALPRTVSFANVATRTRFRIRDLGSRFPGSAIEAVQHHRAHGLYAFASSGYESATVLVVDSLGETQTTTIAYATRDEDGRCSYRTVDSIDDPASLGYAYGAVTQHLGWRRGDEEGTVMALAALGDPARFRPLLAEAIPITPTGFSLDPVLLRLRVMSRRYRRIGQRFIAATCPPRRPDEPVEQVHRDLAAALQERTEEVMLHLARRARSLTGHGLLCVSGGVAVNCVAIGAIAASGVFDELHVPPAPGDSGTAIGAATAAHLAATGALPTELADRCYVGPSYPRLVLPHHPRPGTTAIRAHESARMLARQLAQGSIVGVFRDRLEAGPRALGNRSILASPLQPDVVGRLNATVKFREPFRPFAPVVLAAKGGEYFTLSQPSPYMSIAAEATPLARETVPAIVHVNGTARVQTVTPSQNPFIAEVLDEFASITGVPVLINTSLNVKGKPICGTPDMALDCLVESGLDALLIEDWWVSK